MTEAETNVMNMKKKLLENNRNELKETKQRLEQKKHEMEKRV